VKAEQLSCLVCCGHVENVGIGGGSPATGSFIELALDGLSMTTHNSGVFLLDLSELILETCDSSVTHMVPEPHGM
jgi:hypothetical protein